MLLTSSVINWVVRGVDRQGERPVGALGPSACNIPDDDGRALKAVQCALYEPIRRRVRDVLTLHPGKPVRWSVATG